GAPGLPGRYELRDGLPSRCRRRARAAAALHRLASICRSEVIRSWAVGAIGNEARFSGGRWQMAHRSSLSPCNISCRFGEFGPGLCLLPEPQRDWNRIDVELLPPCGFIAGTMEFAVMKATEGDEELVAYCAA